MIYTTSYGSKIDITKHNVKNAYIGRFIGNSNISNIYGDSINEVLKEAEEMENNNEQLCKN